MLQTMKRIATTFTKVDTPVDVGFKSMIINEAVAALPGIAEIVDSYLNEFNHQAASKDDKYNFFKDEETKYEAIHDKKMGIIAVEQELNDQLPEIAKQLKKKKVTYVTVSQIEVGYPFILEVFTG